MKNTEKQRQAFYKAQARALGIDFFAQTGALMKACGRTRSVSI